MPERTNVESPQMHSPPVYVGRLALQQRILPVYRAPFFDALARACQGGLQIFVGEPSPGESITQATKLESAQVRRTRNRHFLNPNSPFYLCWQDGLVEWLQSYQPDAVILEANFRYPNTYRAISSLQRMKKPVVGWGLGAPRLDGAAGAILNLARKVFLKKFDAIIAYSHKGAEEFQRLGIPPQRIFVAFNAVTSRPDGPPPERPAHLDGPPVVLFVGRLQPRKRVDLLIQACAQLPPEIQPQLRIVGDGPARMELETLAREIYPKSEFLGAIHGPGLEPVYASADLFVLPGTGGLAVQEAMAKGLPVIVARGDGTQEDLVRPENGWQIPADDLHALNGALSAALSNPGILRRMGLASHRIVRDEINIENMVSVFLNALSSVA